MRHLCLLIVVGALSFPASSAPAGDALALAAQAQFYYEDLDRAARFYREHLGLVPVETHEDAVVLELAPGALLRLATLESGGYRPDTPRTAAIALVTDQLDEWWAALARRGLSMRTTNYEPLPGRAHHGFVLEDPEGWFLEFERFNPHPENTQLMPRLDALPTRFVDAAAAGLPEGLGFKAMVLWFYYRDLAAAEAFVVDRLDLPLVTDQGWAKIHPVAPAAYLGLVDGARGMHAFTEEKAVVFEVLDPKAVSRAQVFRRRGLDVERLGENAVEIRDPGGYRLRWRDPGGPEAYADYLVLGKSVNTRQRPDGSLHTLNSVFFSEVFETALGGVTDAVLTGPGDAAAGLHFPEGRIHFLSGERQGSIAELTEHYPDATYRFSFNTPAGPVNALPVTFKAGVDAARNPGPIRLSLRQQGRRVSGQDVDSSLDLEVEWTPFHKGAADPLGIADDMIYVIVGNCFGEEIVHSGHAISDGESLTFRDTRFTIPAAALHPGEVFQLEVEHSEMDTGRERGIETIVTYAATTFLDIRTRGLSPEQGQCPPVPWAMDGGQTDRQRPPES